MSLELIWHDNAVSEPRQVSVAVFGAQLQLTLQGDLIVDCSWLLDATPPTDRHDALVGAIERYLLAPHQTSLRLDVLVQGSVFYRRVWQALLAIPLGQTVCYSALADQLGSGARAVAGACRGNPYAGLIPCHRVVAKSGLGGFMGFRDGAMVELKRNILAAERQIAGGS